jgi:type IV pilus assembly protein PilB
LRDFLIDAGLLTRGQLAQLLEEEQLIEAEQRPLYQLLVERNVVAEDELRRAAAHATGTQFVVIAKEDISPTALLLIPEPISRLRNILAYRLDGGILEVALLDLDDLAYLEPLKLPYKIHPRLTSRVTIKQGLIKYQKILREKFGALLQQGSYAVDALIHHALLSAAHGIHIDINTTTLVRYRIGTALHEAMQLPRQVGSELSKQLKVLAKLLPTSHSVQEGRFKFEKDGERHIVHVSALPNVSGERVVLRVARESAGTTGFALTSLGFHGQTLEQIHQLLGQRSGLVAVTGPRQSGKTTTLYTLLDQLNHSHLSIATIEEKIEHPFPHIAQTQTRPEVGLTTTAGLRALLRQDPDVVMVGHATDLDTLMVALHAANNGVLVLLGVEAPSAGGAIEKMLTLGIPPLLLTSVLRAVVSVDIVGRLCTHEKESYTLSRAEAAPLEPYADFARVLAALKEEKVIDLDVPWKELLFARTIACSQCEGGYEGVAGVQALLPITQSIKEMLLRGASGAELEAQAHTEGMLSIVEDGLMKAAQSTTSIEEIFGLVDRMQ